MKCARLILSEGSWMGRPQLDVLEELDAPRPNGETFMPYLHLNPGDELRAQVGRLTVVVKIEEQPA